MTTKNSNSDAEFTDAYRVLTRSTTKDLTKILIDALHLAVSSSKPTLLRNLVEFSSEILKTPEAGELLWHALDKGNLEMAMTLVRAGVNLDVKKSDCPEDISFLHCMAQQGNSRGYFQLALLMMDRGADINARDFSGLSVLFHAIFYDSVNLAKELLRRGATIDAYNGEQSTSVLLLGLDKKNAEYLLELLVWSVEDEDTRNERAMFIAEFYIDDNADLRRIKKILDRGLPVDYVNPYGWTLLNRAVAWARMDLIELLLDYGANVNNETKFGYCPLFVAVGLPETFVTALLIERGANFRVCNRDGEYAIHRACESQSVKNIQLLLQLGIDINVKNKRDETPFSLMNSELLTAAEVFVVRHLALLSSKGEKIDKSDVELVRQRLETERFYEVCLRELEKMKNNTICNGISYFCLLDKNSRELSMYVKNVEFVDGFNEKLRQAQDSFPLHFKQMKLKFEIANKMEKLSLSTRTHVAEIFSDLLPCLVTDKIAFNLCFDEWKNVEKNYYLQLHEIV